jgi:serine/threonine-protein kinase
MFAEDRYSVELLNQRDHRTLDSLMTDALAARRAALGAWHPMSVKALATLGLSANANQADSARSARAPDFFREALAVAEGPDSARYAAAMDSPADARDARSDLHYSLAAHYLERGQPEEAVEPMRRAVELSTEPLSSLSRQMLENGYGVLLRTLERYDESIAVHRRVTAAARAAHGPDHPMYGHTVLSLGSAYYAADRYEEATRTLRDALRIFGGPASESPTALEVRYYLGESLVKGGQTAEGRAVLRAALPGLLRIHGPESRFVTNTQKSLGQR